MIAHHAALISTYGLVSAAGRDMTDAELSAIGDIVGYLPVFRDFDRERLTKVASDCAELLNGEDGLDTVFDRIKAALPEKLRETAYAMACDVAAAVSTVTQEELRLLEIIRDRLAIER